MRRTQKKDAVADGAELAVLRERTARLEAENRELQRQRDALVARMKDIRTKVEAKVREIQAGVDRRLRDGDDRSSIMEYIKGGFGTMLGVIAALAVVDLVAAGFEGLASGGDEPPADDAGGDGDGLFDGFDGLDGFALLGGGGKQQRKKKAGPASAVASRRNGRNGSTASSRGPRAAPVRVGAGAGQGGSRRRGGSAC